MDVSIHKVSRYMKKSLLVLLIVLLLTGCATGYYGDNLFTGDGYKEKSLSSDTMLVTFNGNGFTNANKTYSYAMKRAAQVTLKHGYSYFLVLNNRSFLVPHTTSVDFDVQTTNFPTTELTIQFVRSKTDKAYDAKKVFAEIVK